MSATVERSALNFASIVLVLGPGILQAQGFGVSLDPTQRIDSEFGMLHDT